MRARDDPHATPKSKPLAPNRKRALNAFTIAEQQFPSKTGLARHRLGAEEDEEDSYGHQNKRRRTQDGGEAGDAGVGADEDHFTDSDGNEFKIGEVDSDDDSDIDSDEALGSDEEAFAGYSFRGSSKNQKKGKGKGQRGKKQQGSDEDDEEEEDAEMSDDSLGSDAVDLATAWDMNGEESEEEQQQKTKKQNTKKGKKISAAQDFGDFEDSSAEGEDFDDKDEDEQDLSGSEAASESEEASDDESASESESDSDEDEDNEEDLLSVSEDEGTSHKRGLTKLQKFVNNLNPDLPGTTSATSRSNAAVQGGAPSEFGLLPSRKLTAADLMPTISDSRLKSSLKYVDAEPSTKAPGVSGGVPGKLDVPLAKRQQDRIDRAAAFEKSKETLDRWIDTVKHNRRAEHLSFPLPEQGKNEQPRIQDTRHRTDLESAIQNILAESGLAESANDGKSAEKKIQEYEELEAKKIPLEEIQARRAELRKARELMFREEARAKRIKKIKSKSYRRVHRKERERMDQKEREALAAAGVEMEEEDREAADRQRALARMGAKHRESKFAKSLKQTGRAGWDDEARQNVLDAARRQEELQARIEGKRVRGEDEDYLSTSSSGSEMSEDDSDDGDGFADPDAQVKKLNKKLDKLSAGGSASTDAPIEGPYAKLMGMKFMQNADAARKAANDAEVRTLRRELGQGTGDSSDYDSEDEAGRFKFGKTEQNKKNTKTPAQERREFEAPEDDDGQRIVEDSENEVQIKVDSAPASETVRGAKKGASDKKNKKTSVSALSAQQPAEESDEEESNPWLAEPGQEKRRNRKTVDISAEKSLIDNENQPSKTSVKTVKEPASKPKTKAPQKKQQQSSLPQDEETSDSGSDSDSETKVPVLLKNADLVKRAFAGDEVLDTFEKEKHDVMEEEDDKVVDTTLPGWGSWVGDGLTKREKKAQKKTTDVIEGIKAQNRKDAKLDRVIINEKRQRKVSSLFHFQLMLWICLLIIHLYRTSNTWLLSYLIPSSPDSSMSAHCVFLLVLSGLQRQPSRTPPSLVS